MGKGGGKDSRVKKKKKPKAIDLFCGCGGFTVRVKQVSFIFLETMGYFDIGRFFNGRQ